MGNIRLRILYGDQEIEEFRNKTVYEYNHYLYLAERYNFPLLQQINTVEKEITIDIKGIDSIDWDEFDLGDSVLQTLKAFEYCYNARRKLQVLLNKVDGVRYESRYDLWTLANEAIELLAEFKVPDSLRIPFWGSQLSTALAHTRNQEVHMLVDYNAKSKREQESRMRDAVKHLKSDLEGAVNMFRYLELKVNN